MLIRMFVVLVALTLSGCASFDVTGAGARTAIEVATLEFIDSDQERANRVYEITSDLLEITDADNERPIRETLDVIEERARDRIEWSRLDKAEALLVHRLIDGVRAEIQYRVNQGTLNGSQRVAIQTVLRWIRDMAQLSGGGFDGLAMEDLGSNTGMAFWREIGPQRATDRA